MYVPNRPQLQKFQALCDEAYKLLVRVVGGDAMNKDSRVMVDRFNAVDATERRNGWCHNPQGGIQKLRALSKDTKVFDFNDLTLTEYSLQIPVVILDNVALFTVSGSMVGGAGLTVDVHIGTQQDITSIRRNPSCYNAHTHACIEQSHNSTVVVNTRSCAVDRTGRVPVTSSKLMMRTLSPMLTSGATPSGATPLGATPSGIGAPYSVAAWTNPEGKVSQLRVFPSGPHWSCALRADGIILVQKDSAPLRLKDISETDIDQLHTTMQLLKESFTVTYLAVLQKMNNATTKESKNLEGIDNSFVCRASRNVFDDIETARSALVSTFQLLRLVSDMTPDPTSKVADCFDYHAHDLYSVDVIQQAIAIMREQQIGSPMYSECILAARCGDILIAVVNAVNKVRGNGRYSEMVPLPRNHQAQLGPIKHVTTLAGNNIRTNLLLRVAPPGAAELRSAACTHDLLVLQINHVNATDPEFFSNDQRLHGIKEASSVRCVLSHQIGCLPSDLLIGHVSRPPVLNLRRCTTSVSLVNVRQCPHTTMNCQNLATFHVEWKVKDESPTARWHGACIQVNTCSGDRVLPDVINGKTVGIRYDESWYMKVLNLDVYA